MSLKKYYFPPVGFGLWFQLGVLNNIKDEEYEIYGGSGGSIICMLSILNEKDRDISKIIEISEKIRRNKNQINFYYYLDKFIENIFILLDNYEVGYIKKKLETIHIEVSVWSLPPKRKFLKPHSLTELRHYVIASCYFPLIFFYTNPFYYYYKKEYMFDAFFSGFSNVSNDFIKIDSYAYSTIVPLSNSHFEKMFMDGLKYKVSKKNVSFTILTFLKITFQILRDLIKYPFINCSFKN
jgi:hypothetical protein